MRIKAFIQYQFFQYILRWRWLLPVPVGLLLGHWANNVILVLNPDLSIFARPEGNALEAFIWAFGKPEIVYFVATALFIYLVSDLLPEKTFGQWALLRLQSRSAWWFSKVFLVFLSTIAYGVLLFASFFLPVFPQYPFSLNWSPVGLNNFGIAIGYSLKNNGPVQGALWIGALLLLGWFAIGLLILTINQLTQRSWAGFLAAALIVITAELGAISGGPIGGEGWQSYFLIQNHLEYTPLWAPVRMIPEWTSVIFWCVWILVCSIIGFISSKRRDIIVSNH
jgi:hypothetical protein